MTDLDPEIRKLYNAIEARAGRPLDQAELQRRAARYETQGWLTNPPSERWRQTQPNEPIDRIEMHNALRHAYDDQGRGDALIQFARALGFELSPWQEQLLRDMCRAYPDHAVVPGEVARPQQAR